MVCKILHVEEVQLEGDVLEILYVWDSTDANPQNHTYTTEDSQSRLIIETATKFKRLDIPLECVEHAPNVGSIMPIFRIKKDPNRIVLEAGLLNHTEVVTPLPSAGSYVKFKNLMPTVNEYQLQCFITSYTVWTLQLEEFSHKE